MERPILFSTPMVQAILEDRKTQTRRVIKPQPEEHEHYGLPASWRFEKPQYFNTDKNFWACEYCGEGVLPDGTTKYKSPYIPDDILYVRETWGFDKNNWLYKADFSDNDPKLIKNITKWRPSIFMPREAARIFLKVTNVKVERLQDITEEDAKAEGVNGIPRSRVLYPNDDYIYPFKQLWNSLNQKRGYGWDTNPWVWVIEFEKISKDLSALNAND